MTSSPWLGWIGIIRLGLVQTALGAIVVLTTTVINRVMVVELALPALLPGLLVGVHFGVQFTRPHMGHGSDCGGRRTPWIIGGVLTLAIGSILAAMGTAVIPASLAGGIALALLGFVLVGLGVAAAGTSLLVLLAATVQPRFRGAAATTVWIMMIAGFILTTIVAGAQLDPYSHARLVAVTAAVAAVAFVVATLAVSGIERRFDAPAARAARAALEPAGAKAVTGALPEGESATGSATGSVAVGVAAPRFREALAEVWAEPAARRFSLFVFVSMLAYSAQDLVLEPFAGAVHGFSVGESTILSGTHHQGVLFGLLLVALATARFARRQALSGAMRVVTSRLGSLRFWTLFGCCLSAAALAALGTGAFRPDLAPLTTLVLLLGLGNGLFAAGAIGSMMDLVGQGGAGREGLRMGLWGAAQAIAFGLAGVCATTVVDLARFATGDVRYAYATVFAVQVALFLCAAVLARSVYRPAAPEVRQPFDHRRAALELNT